MRYNTESMSDIADEVADVAIYLFLLVNSLNIDFKTAINWKLKKNKVKYPVTSSPGT